MLESIEVNGKTYSQQMRNCGKACCAGTDGGKHGPYWYLREPGKPVKYVGLSLPAGVRDFQTRLASEADNIKALIAIHRADRLRFEAAARASNDKVIILDRLLHSMSVTNEQATELGLVALLPMP